MMNRTSFEEERKYLLEQSDYYLKAADKVSDPLTKSSLLYLSSSSLYKAEQLLLAFNGDKYNNIGSDEKADNDTKSASFEYTLYKGRMRTSNHNCIDSIDNITKSLNSGSCVIRDLLELERKLADIDLFIPDINIKNINNNLMKEDSFILLSAAARKVKNENIIENNNSLNIFEDKHKEPIDFISINNADNNDTKDEYKENVMRLLQCINRLNEENIDLVKRNEMLHSIQTNRYNTFQALYIIKLIIINRLKVKKEIDEFKADFSNKFRKLKYVLEDFSKQYPHENNPANIYTVLTKDTSVKLNEVSALMQRQEKLERMVQAFLVRLEKSNAELKFIMQKTLL